MKKIPMRTCVITKEKLPKKELVRIVRTPENTIVVDESGKVNGHGAYLKNSIEVFNKAKTSKVLNRILGIEIPDSIYEELINKVGE